MIDFKKGRTSRRSMDDLDKGDNYTVRDIGLAENGALYTSIGPVPECRCWPNSKKKLSKPSLSQACVAAAFT